MNDEQMIWEAYANISKDKEYFYAHESGDLEKAKRLIEEKAKKLRLIPAYHGTHQEELINHEFGGEDAPYRGGLRSFFASDRRFAEGYGSKVYDCYLNIKKPLDFRNQNDIKNEAEDFYEYIGGITDIDDIHRLEVGDGRDPDQSNRYNVYPLENFVDKLLKGNWDAFECTQFQEYILKNGYYDSVIMHEDGPVSSVTYGIYYPNQAKLADTFTYDDNKKLIQLSERFDFDIDDFRY